MVFKNITGRYSCCFMILLYSDAVNMESYSFPEEADNKQTFCQENGLENLDVCPVGNDNLQTVQKLDTYKMTSLAIIPYDKNNIPLHERSTRHFSIAGHTFTIPQDYLGLGVSACVWDAAVVLAKYLQKQKHLVQGKKVLELGSGTGLTGLVAAALGADVIVTERAEAMTHLTSSIRQNTQDKSWKISAQVLDWTKRFEPQDFTDIDVILGSDIVYVESTFQDLLETIKTLAPSNRVQILLSCRIRYDRDVRFLDMLKKDFDVEEIFVDTEQKIQIFSGYRHS